MKGLNVQQRAATLSSVFLILIVSQSLSFGMVRYVADRIQREQTDKMRVLTAEMNTASRLHQEKRYTELSHQSQRMYAQWEDSWSANWRMPVTYALAIVHLIGLAWVASLQIRLAVENMKSARPV